MEGGESARVFPMEELTAIVGTQHQQLCKTLIHLVMADSAYVENPNQGKQYQYRGYRSPALIWSGL